MGQSSLAKRGRFGNCFNSHNDVVGVDGNHSVSEDRCQSFSNCSGNRIGCCVHGWGHFLFADKEKQENTRCYKSRAALHLENALTQSPRATEMVPRSPSGHVRIARLSGNCSNFAIGQGSPAWAAQMIDVNISVKFEIILVLVLARGTRYVGLN